MIKAVIMDLLPLEEKNESISDATGIEFFADSGSGNLSLVNLTFYGYRLRQNTSGGHSTNAYGSD